MKLDLDGVNQLTDSLGTSFITSSRWRKNVVSQEQIPLPPLGNSSPLGGEVVLYSLDTPITFFCFF
jgi:hypothetical protein